MRFYSNFEFQHPLIAEAPASDLRVIAVTPALNEQKLFRTIDSLYHAEKLDQGSVEVIVVLNESDEAGVEIRDFHREQMDQLLKWSEAYNDHKFRLYPLWIKSIPWKSAGVGYARKVGMDEAMHRFLKTGRTEGIISCPDADVTVQKNYFTALVAAFDANPGMQAASIHFEHDLETAADNGLKDEILRYECHLRYMVQMQRLIGLPYAFHTVGSSMAVNVKGYIEQFGMNKRKAGEDFYFLHKFINAGYLFEINNTTVYPEARYSDRVPFGTGRSMNQSTDDGLKTYHYRTYESLYSLTSRLHDLYENATADFDQLEEPVKQFFGIKLVKQIAEIKSQTKDFGMFQKRFYRWFDAFQLIKYQHFCRDQFFENIPVEAACSYLFNKMALTANGNLEEKLLVLRNIARSGNIKGEHKTPF